MKKANGRILSRREFAQRAAMLSATASIVSPAVMLEAPAETSLHDQAQPSAPKLSPEGQAEADARYQLVLKLYGDRLSDEQKTQVKKMCVELQPALDRIRAYKLDNGEAPALYLKPLYEREKQPQTATASTSAPPAARKP
jgi:hypothetical protein